MNGKYLGRYRVDSDSVKSYPVKIPEGQKDNTLTIYKATEASNGNVIFTGISCKILKPVKAINQKYIEFIGNSITCGMGSSMMKSPAVRNNGMISIMPTGHSVPSLHGN